MRNKTLYRGVWAAITVFAVFVEPAAADPLGTYYTDFAAWNATTSGATLVDFESVPIGSYSTPLTINNARFAGSCGELDVAVGAFGTGNILKGPVSSATPCVYSVILVPAGNTAWSAYFANTPSGHDIVFTTYLVGGDNISATVAANSNSLGFLGFVSNAGEIDDIVFATHDPAATQTVIDDFRFGAAASSSVPEPSPFAVIGSGILALGMSRRWRTPA